MNETLLQRAQAWKQGFLGRVNPVANWAAKQVQVSHGIGAVAEQYPALLHHPADWHYKDARAGQTAPSELTAPKRNPDAQEISVDDGQGEPFTLHAQPHSPGRHVITGGTGGRFNGLYLTGLRSPQQQRQAAQERAEAKRAEVRMQALMERQQAERLAIEAKHTGEALLNVHQLPMTDAQEERFARNAHLLNALGLMNSSQAQTTLRELRPQDFGGDKPGEAVTNYWMGRQPKLREAVTDALLHDHPEGAKAQWLKEFAGKHSEPLVVVAQRPEAVSSIRQALEASGRAVGRVDPASSTGEQAESMFSFMPLRDGKSRKDALIVSDPDMAHTYQPHHRIYYDSAPTQPHNSKQHLSAHQLIVDGEKPGGQFWNL